MWNRLIPLARSPIGDSMADPRIIDVQLDERTILWRSADVEQERRIAIYDLLEGNHFAPRRPHDDGRSEEHTSELQSLMRISYAVFCLNKKTTPITNNNTSKQTITKLQQRIRSPINSL